MFPPGGAGPPVLFISAPAEDGAPLFYKAASHICQAGFAQASLSGFPNAAWVCWLPFAVPCSSDSPYSATIPSLPSHRAHGRHCS